jgi:hypothetical protein
MNAGIQARIWFYYADEEQVGPIHLHELKQAIEDGIIGPQDYVYREGFQDWKLLSEVTELSHLQPTPEPPAHPRNRSGEQRSSKRVPIRELVIAHNDSRIASGSLTDISVSGVFFKTQENCFSINDEVKITLKEGKGLGKPMHIRGTVVRQAKESGVCVGYGLELKNLDERSRTTIIDYVKRNQAS